MKQAFILLLIFLSLQLQAQKTYSIGLDADNDQFFSVAIGKKTYASSSIGHLLITGLKDSTYQLLISFPRSNYSSESFTVTIDKSDRKLLLKKINDKQWNLQDLQTNAWLKQKTGSNQLATVTNEADLARSREAFKKLMAAVVNDTAILNTEYEIAVPKKEVLVKKEETDKPIPSAKDSTGKALPKKSDTSLITKKDEPIVLVDSIQKKPVLAAADTKLPANQPATDSSELKKSDSALVVKKRIPNTDSNRNERSSVGTKPRIAETVSTLYETNRANEKEIAFLTSDSNGVKDTVRISIQLDKEVFIEKRPADSLSKVEEEIVPKKADTVLVAVADSSKVNSKPVAKTDSAVKKITIINSDCRNFASEADLDRLRVKMIAENRMEERIVVAKKYFKTKCFTTRQIRALTELFVSDKTRYEFFDAAYPFVSDSSEFKSLLDLLTDEYYIGRFKAMVRIVENR